jgi:hypothetical protein
MIDLNSATATAVGLLVSVAVFSIGFVSVSVHAELSRQRDRVEQLTERFTQDEAVSDDAIRLADAASDPKQVGVALAVVGMNIALLSVNVALLIYWAVDVANWHWVGPTQASPTFWPLLTVGVAHAAVVGLGTYDVTSVRSNLTAMHDASPAHQLVTAQACFEKHDVNGALQRVAPLAQTMPGAPWPARLHGLVELDLNNPGAALRSFEAAIAAAARLPIAHDLPSEAGRARALEQLPGRGADTARLWLASLNTLAFHYLPSPEQERHLDAGPEKAATWLATLEAIGGETPSDVVGLVARRTAQKVRGDSAGMDRLVRAVVDIRDRGINLGTDWIRVWLGGEGEVARRVNEALRGAEPTATPNSTF